MANIRPYNGEPYDIFPWGSSGYITGYASPEVSSETSKPAINLTYYTNHSRDMLIYLRYDIYNRYKGTEINIEDIYSNVTYRALALGCLDGPLFAYASRLSNEE